MLAISDEAQILHEMGATFVTLGRDAFGEPVADVDRRVGFWMRDSVLELWLRLLALHLADPGEADDVAARIRNGWLLASRGYFPGCVPHNLEDATSQSSGLQCVREAVASLSKALEASTAPLSARTLNLLGSTGTVWTVDLDVEVLREVAAAFADLLSFRIRSTASEGATMPGTGRWQTA